MRRFWQDSNYSWDPHAQNIFSGLLLLGGAIAVVSLVHGVPRTLWALLGMPLFGCGFWLTFRIRTAEHDGRTLAYGFGALVCFVVGGVVVRVIAG